MDVTSARRVGKSDLAVTPLGFGGGTIGSPQVSTEASLETVFAAWASGSRFYDTAPWYGIGRSERRLGLALAAVAQRDAYHVIFAEFIFNGVFERFPGLTVVGGEVGAGWVPFLLQEIDDRYRRNRYWCEVDLSMLPSEYYRRNCKVGLVNDQFGVQNCDAVGVETMMWCSDFPHHITDWPHSRYLINSMSQGLDAEKKRKIFCENAGKLYGFL